MTKQPPREVRDKDAISPRLIVGGVLALLALLFVFQNTGRGQVSFLFWHVDAPTWTWLVLILAVGFVVGSLFPWFRRRR